MIFRSLFIATSLASIALGCPQHENNKRSRLMGRQTTENGTTNQNDWAYEASFNWGKINPDYARCQMGTQQSPIALSLSNGLSLNHVPTFSFDGPVNGNFYNWGYGPAFTAEHDGDWTKHPSVTYDDTTVYLKGWHIHAPGDHTVGGVRSKAELHMVMVDDTGHEKAVMGIRLDPGNGNNTFFEQLPAIIGFNELDTFEPVSLDFAPALQSVLYFNEFWTYQGSLTSPPCSEGIRWFMARQILFTGVQQMQDILGASTYSARAEQEVWQHRINQ